MVALRERKARPSYNIIPDGLANLTDSEDGRSNSDNEDRQENIASGSGTGDIPTSAKNRVPIGSVSPQIRRGGRRNDDDSDVSSGDSSAFAPSEKVRGKGKAAQKGNKGKSGVREDESSSDEFEEGDVDAAEELKELEDSDEDQEMGSGEEEEDGSGMDSDNNRQRKKGKGKPSILSKSKSRNQPASSKDRRAGKPLAAPPVYIQSDLNLVPPAYRQLIRSSTESMVKSQTINPKLWIRDKKSRLDVDAFPSGTGLPFITRLTQPPGKGRDVRIEMAGDKDSRRRRAVACDKAMTVGLGWEGWEGEGWWKEMYTGDLKGKGKAKMEGWKFRGEVRLGLDNVGRLGMDGLEFVSEQDIYRYLPKAETVHVHLGPHDEQTAVGMEIFEHVNMARYTKLKEGCVFNAGGPIWGMDWCPLPEDQATHYDNKHYLAVTTLPEADTKPSTGVKGPRDSPSGIQIWSMVLPNAEIDEPGRMKCEMILCVKGGPGMQCKWMPMGAWDDCDPKTVDESRLPKLGILAVLQLDGSVSFYTVPHPMAIRGSRRGRDMDVDGDQVGPLYIKCHEPILRIEIADAVPTSMDWLTGSKLAIGYSHGSVAVWDIVEALKSGQKADLLPHIYVNIAQSSISALKAGRVPSCDANGEPQFDEDPRFIVVSSWDGTTNMLDIRDPAHPVHLERSRLPSYTIGWSSQNQSPLLADSDYNLSIYKIRGIPVSRYLCMASHRGPLWDIGSSDFHTMVASGGTDGAVILSSAQQGMFRAKKTPLYFWRLLEIDYDEVTGHYRLTDDFVPETMTLETASGRKTSKKAQAAHSNPAAMKAGNWDPRVSIHRITWNEGSGLARAGMLAMGSASGLGIVQIVEPKWRIGADVKKFDKA